MKRQSVLMDMSQLLIAVSARAGRLIFLAVLSPALHAQEVKGKLPVNHAPEFNWLDYSAEVFFWLAIVVGAIFLIAKVVRRAIVSPAMPGASSGPLKAVSSLTLGPGQRLVLVEVGGKQMLVGVTANSVRAVHVLDTRVETTPLPNDERMNTQRFYELLKKHMQKPK